MCILTRGLSPELIDVLQAAPFWQEIINDPDLHPAIRNDSITVYYRGAALLRELRLDGGVLTGLTHYKYVPLRPPITTMYVSLTSVAGSLELGDDFRPMPIGDGNADVLDEYKRLIAALHNTAESETVDQLCRWNNQLWNLIVDQEVEFQLANERTIDRIDLLHYDTTLECAAFVEVKGIEDSRLVAPPNQVPEVVHQMARYRARIAEHSQEILEAFNVMVDAKRQLGLEERMAGIPNQVPRILSRALLVIGDCSRKDVGSITREEGPWGALIDGLREEAAGLILCGKRGGNLDLQMRRQLSVFDDGVFEWE